LPGRGASASHLPQVLKIDLFGHAHGSWDESELDRRRVVTVRGDRTLFVKAPEDTIVRKLLGFREGGEVSDR
jgi:hypothetical protein